MLFGCFTQTVGCVARAGRSATKPNGAWVQMPWILTKDDVYCSFLKTWHSLDHLDEQGTWFTSSEHCHPFLNSSKYKRRFLKVTGFSLVHITAWSPNLLFAEKSSNSAPSFELCHAQTCMWHSRDNKPLNRPDQLTDLRRGTGRERQKIRLTWSYVSTEVYWYRILFLLI